MDSSRMGPYDIIDEIATGGQGTVFRARHRDSGREVALKALKEAPEQDASTLTRFRREIDVLASFDHPNIVRLLDAGVEGETSYLAMELLEGKTMATVLARGTELAHAEVMEVIVGVVEALAELHGKGVLHRDIKPSNIFITVDGVVKLLDFGLARITGGAACTEKGTLLGTLHYMAPEILLGDEPSPRSDLWSTGVVLYQLLTGRFPVEATGMADLLAQMACPRIVAPDQARPGVPGPVSRLCMALLESDPEKRVPGAREFLARVRQAGLRRDPGRVAVPAGSRSLWLRWLLLFLLIVGIAMVLVAVRL